MLYSLLLLVFTTLHSVAGCMSTSGFPIEFDYDMDGLSDAYEQELAERFAPHVYFHPDETFFPVSAETFVNHSTLLYRGSLYSAECTIESKGSFQAHTLPVLRTPQALRPWEMCNPNAFALKQERDHVYTVTAQQLARKKLRGATSSSSGSSSVDANGSSSPSDDLSDVCKMKSLTCYEFEYPCDPTNNPVIQCVDNNYQEYVFSEHNDVAYDATKGFSLELGQDTVEKWFKGSSSPDELADVPAYVHVFPTKNNNFPPDAITIQYWFLYPFSGQAEHTFHGGQHEGDWEHVSIVISNRTHVIYGAYFAAHSHESSWLTAPDYEVMDGHVRVFAALSTHANYPTVGHKSRELGLLVDECSSEGVQWQPRVVNMGELNRPMPRARWLLYNGFWGSSRLLYGPLPVPTGFPPRTPSYQSDYWLEN